MCELEPTPEESKSSVLIEFKPLWNQEISPAGTEFQDQFGNRLRLFNFKTYLSDLKLLHDDGSSLLSEVELLNFNDGTVTLTYDIENNTNFSGISFATGVPAEYNVDYDPSTWPNAHPLSIQGGQGMHWEWNTGYKFTIFDGKADTTELPEPSYLYPFTFHCGDDSFYTNHSFDLEISSGQETEHSVSFKINMDEFLNNIHSIDIREDGETHTGGDFDLAQQFIDNFNQAIVLE